LVLKGTKRPNKAFTYQTVQQVKIAFISETVNHARR